MLVFGPDKRKAVTISLNVADWGCILEDGRELDGSLMDFLLRHIVYRTHPEVRQYYALTHNWMSSVMQSKLDDAGTWDEVVYYIYRIVRTVSGLEDTLVVPYQNKGHWSIFVVEDSQTLQFDTLNMHRDERAGIFAFVLHMAWAMARGVSPKSDMWKKWQGRKVKRVPIPKQELAWECGYLSCLAFWQYMVIRGSSASSDPVALDRQEWQDWAGSKARLWLVQALYLELVSPPIGFSKPTVDVWSPVQAYVLASENMEGDDETMEMSPETGRRSTTRAPINLGIHQTISYHLKGCRVRQVPGEAPTEGVKKPAGRGQEASM